MKVERTDDEILIRLQGNIRKENLEGIVEYLRYEELLSKSQATEDDLDALVSEAKQGRWERIKSEISWSEKNNS